MTLSFKFTLETHAVPVTALTLSAFGLVPEIRRLEGTQDASIFLVLFRIVPCTLHHVLKKNQVKPNCEAVSNKGGMGASPSTP